MKIKAAIAMPLLFASMISFAGEDAQPETTAAPETIEKVAKAPETTKETVETAVIEK